MASLLKDRRIQLLLVLIALAGLLLALNGIHFGIEFVGGTRIPVTLGKSVDASTMSQVIETIKTRVNKYGLSQVIVKGVGDNQIIVEVPKSDPTVIQSIERLLREQGRFEAIIDGRLALTGEDIINIGSSGHEVSSGPAGVQWAVDFAISRAAGERFSKVALGKAEYPVYMFLDRPENAVLIMSPEDLALNVTAGHEQVMEVLQAALRKESDTVDLLQLTDWNTTKTQLLSLNKTNATVVISETADPTIVADLNASGYKMLLRNPAEMRPELFERPLEGVLSLSSWPAIGLLSAPTLQRSITEGSVSQFYQITGAGSGRTQAEQQQSAQNEVRTLKSILSGGRLPVNTIIGSSTSVSPSLGAEFLKYSAIGSVLAVFAVVLWIFIRYRNTKIVLPIIATSFIELFILLAVIGSLGTIDLAAFAGIIGAIGVGVDAQIVITDEILRREVATTESSAKRGFTKALEIIMTNAAVAVAAMIPLLFSGLTEIMGFAISSILGMLLGVLVTRPAYGAMLTRIFEKEKAV